MEGSIQVVARRIRIRTSPKILRTKRRKRNRGRSPLQKIEWAKDGIPENAVWLSVAFARVYDALEAEPSKVRLEEDERKALRANTDADLRRFIGDNYPPQDLDTIVLGKEANLFIRQCLGSRELVAYVRDPRTGENLQLPERDWEDIEFFPGELGWMNFDHLSPDDPVFPGPPAWWLQERRAHLFF
jgi:hypothetical protein